ncbi:MAG: glutamate cyclase domain-containing protein, partial [Stellaceae bacterium]
MAGAADARALVGRIERLVQTEVGRNIGALCDAAQGGLWSAAAALAAAQPCRVGLITGFYVPLGSPPAAETDGPVGAALLARGLAAIGIPCRLATDEPCRGACAVALAAAGAGEVPVDAVAIGAKLSPQIEAWRSSGITHAIAIERCGRGADGHLRNMRGQDISAYTAPLDDLFAAGPWDTIAVGDGGNEIGMGSLPRGLIARHVEHGETIACITP